MIRENFLRSLYASGAKSDAHDDIPCNKTTTPSPDPFVSRTWWGADDVNTVREREPVRTLPATSAALSKVRPSEKSGKGLGNWIEREVPMDSDEEGVGAGGRGREAARRDGAVKDAVGCSDATSNKRAQNSHPVPISLRMLTSRREN